jgi:polysaccharide biosynthesis protein PslG
MVTDTPSINGLPALAAPLAVASVPATASGKKATGAKSATSGATANSKAAGGPASGGPVFGFAAPEVLDWSPTEQVQQLEAMKATGITSVRVDASWYNTQLNGPNSYNWTPLDAAVSSIHQAGLTADLIIDGCPPWAAAPGAQGQFAQPASPTAFANWAAAVATRYDGEGAEYFEIWNEPNNPAFWSPAPNPAAYTADLKAAYAAIKAVDPSAVVLTGGLAPQANSSNSYDIVTFFQDMYADGAQGSFDGVGDHPYTFPYTPESATLGSAWSEMSQTSPSLRSLMVAHGDSAKKIWITEFGAPTGSAGVSETDQSDEISQAIAFVKQSSWIGSFYVYSWEDGSTASFGLLDDNGTPKPAYGAMVAALAK